MYRAASPSLEDTIQRLEEEIVQLRALGGKRRERQLVATAVVSMMIAAHAVIGCLVTRMQAERMVGHASKRLEARARDVMTCIHVADARSREVDACRAEKNACTESASVGLSQMSGAQDR
ncbi:MAG: hypothetical protein M3O50_20570 [Myxococcota bacterium]|nr:hypothetical protein [Myxococcota bacterium]